MENINIINFMLEASYLENIQVTKTNNTTTIVDTTNNVIFSLTYCKEFPKKMHCYFIDTNNNCYLTVGTNRITIMNKEDFDKKTLPDDWGEEDLLILHNNRVIFSSSEYVLVSAFNYFNQLVDLLKTTETGAFLHLS